MSRPEFRFRVVILVGSVVVHGRHVNGQMLRRFASAVRPQRAHRRWRLRRQIRRGRVTSNVPADLFAMFRMNYNRGGKTSITRRVMHLYMNYFRWKCTPSKIVLLNIKVGRYENYNKV